MLPALQNRCWRRRIGQRNEIAAAIIGPEHIPIDDLFSLVKDPPEYYKEGDGVHYAPAGVAVQAKQVAEKIAALLDQK